MVLAPRNYNVYTTGGCAGRNELGITNQDTIQDCQNECEAKSCVSFEYGKESKTCHLSSTCTYSKSVKDPNDPFYLYVRGYDEYTTGGCRGQNELGITNRDTIRDCQNECDKFSSVEKCVSFEYEKEGKLCQLSSTCTYSQSK